MSELLRLELRRWGNLPLPRGFLSMDQTQEVSQQLTTVGWMKSGVHQLRER